MEKSRPLFREGAAHDYGTWKGRRVHEDNFRRPSEAHLINGILLVPFSRLSDYALVAGAKKVLLEVSE